MSGPRLRFAPSPTGSLHLGNARTALFNWLIARQQGGRLILRIEDTDLERHQDGAEARIEEDLRWLGLAWDEGPDVGGDHGPYRQSDRVEQYREASRLLLERGQAYRCFCDSGTLESERREQREGGAAIGYSGRCRRLDPTDSERRARSGEPCALRFEVPRGGAGTVAFEDRLRGRIEVGISELSDPVIVREDGRPTYNFAVVVDDAAMEIDLVLRGDDHLSNTPRQILLYEALEHRPPAFAHLPMVRGTDGARLSKRHGAGSLSDYRAQGFPVEGLVNGLALLGWSPGGDRALIGREELVEQFRLEKVNRAPAAFDADRLDWICSQHIQQAPVDVIAAEVAARLQADRALPAALPAGTQGWFQEIAELVRPSISRYGQISQRCRGLFARGGEPVDEADREALRADGAAAVVAELARLVTEDAPETADAWRGIKKSLVERTGARGKALFHPVRLALTGEASGPELDRVVPLITHGHRLFPEQVSSLTRRTERTIQWIG